MTSQLLRGQNLPRNTASSTKEALNTRNRDVGDLLASENVLVHNNNSFTANRLRMLPSLFQRMTIVLALTLLGFVGGLGTGLHLVFDCCHHCDHSHNCSMCCSTSSAASSGHQCCSCCSDSEVVVACSKSGSKTNGTLVIPEHECAICQLLSQFHSTQSDLTVLRSVWTNHQKFILSIPIVFLDSSYRQESSRGPPAVLELDRLALEHV